MLPLLVSACVPATQKPPEPPPISGKVMCLEMQAERAELAASLANSDDERAVMAADALLTEFDASCAG